MSKFIKVTDAKNGNISYHNASSITCFRDGEIWIGNEFAEIVETAEQIEAQLLRDEFATAALNGLLANSSGVVQKSPMSGTGYINGDSETVSAWAYDLADAMLKERTK